jgi:hypothetical protein
VDVSDLGRTHRARKIRRRRSHRHRQPHHDLEWSSQHTSSTNNCTYDHKFNNFALFFFNHLVYDFTHNVDNDCGSECHFAGESIKRKRA